MLICVLICVFFPHTGVINGKPESDFFGPTTHCRRSSHVFQAFFAYKTNHFLCYPAVLAYLHLPLQYNEHQRTFYLISCCHNTESACFHHLLVEGDPWHFLNFCFKIWSADIRLTRFIWFLFISNLPRKHHHILQCKPYNG